MARPRKGSEIGTANTIAVRITEETRRELDKLAAANGTTLTDEVRRAIAAHIGGRFCLEEAA